MLSISMPRGDIRTVQINITGADDIEINEIYFTVKQSFISGQVLFQKRLSSGEIESLGNGTYQLTIEAADTNPLKFGGYVFDIQIVGDGLKETTTGKLFLTEEATYASDE